MHRLLRTVPAFILLLLAVGSWCSLHNVVVSIEEDDDVDEDVDDERIDLDDLEHDAAEVVFDQDTSDTDTADSSTSDGGAASATPAAPANTEDGEMFPAEEEEEEEVLTDMDSTVQDILRRLEAMERSDDGTVDDAEWQELIRSIDTFVDRADAIGDILPGGADVWKDILQASDAAAAFDEYDDEDDDDDVDPEEQQQLQFDGELPTNDLEREVEQIMQSIDAINRDDGNIDIAELQRVIQRIQTFVDADVIDGIMPGGSEIWKDIVRGMGGVSDDVDGGVGHVVTTVSDDVGGGVEHGESTADHVTETDAEEDVIDSSDEKQYYDPMGIQTWSDEKDFVQALAGGRLVLVIIFATWCDKSRNVLRQATRAARLLDDLFASDAFNSLIGDLNLDPSIPLSKPLIGVIDSDIAPPILIESLGGVTFYPAIKYVLTYPDSKLYKDEGNSHSDDTVDDDIVMWDYIGQRESYNDLYESVLMYWYRYSLSYALEGNHKQISSHDTRTPRYPVFSFGSANHLESFLLNHGEKLLRPAHPRLRHQLKNTLLSEVFEFYMGGKHRDISGILHNLKSDVTYRNEQCANMQLSDGDCHPATETTQEIDPFILLIQCRSTETALDNSLSQMANREFDELADEMSHRKDVAFFSLINQPVCNQWLGESSPKSAIAVFRARRFISYSTIDSDENFESEQRSNHFLFEPKFTRSIHGISTNWIEAIQSTPHALYIPSMDSQTKMQSIDKRKINTLLDDPIEATEYVQSMMVQFVIAQTTPTVLWFDRHRTTQLAFPWYRKTHAVLVVDIGLSHQQMHTSTESSRIKNTDDKADTLNEPIWPSKLNKSVAAARLLEIQQKSIQLFYNAALHHRTEHPYDDVVFLIIPSSETRVLTKFGIDIWTHLDEKEFPSEQGGEKESEQHNDSGYCSSRMESGGILPVMILTDSSVRSRKQSNRYYLCSDDIFATSSIPSRNGGTMTEFLYSFLDDTIGDPFIRSESTPYTNSYNAPWQYDKNQANVTVLTGNNFEALVMERRESHSMLLFQTFTCGHCKRFSVLWNEFSRLVQAMNWGSVIEVMKIDVSKNDVPHDKIDVWDVPSVYYFPAGEKDNPVEVTWIGPERNPRTDYYEGLTWIKTGADLVEWIIRQGKLDIELLISLDESKNKPSA